VEKSTRIVSQVYGYAVCLVAVITFLISTTGLVTALIDLGDPLHSGFTPQGSPSLASYENYKADIVKSFQKEAENNSGAIASGEQTFRAMYEAAKNDKIQSSKHQAQKTILISGLILIICIILFFTHWRWMQRLVKSA